MRLTIVIQNIITKLVILDHFSNSRTQLETYDHLELDNPTWDLRSWSGTWYQNLRLTTISNLISQLETYDRDLELENATCDLRSWSRTWARSWYLLPSRTVEIFLSSCPGKVTFSSTTLTTFLEFWKKLIYRFLVKKIICVLLKRERFSFYNRIQKNCFVL